MRAHAPKAKLSTEKKNKFEEKRDQTENQNLHCIESMNWVGGIIHCSYAAIWLHKRVLT